MFVLGSIFLVSQITSQKFIDGRIKSSGLISLEISTLLIGFAILVYAYVCDVKNNGTERQTGISSTLRENKEVELDYGNWIRRKNLIILGLCALGVGVLTAVPLGPIYRVVTAVLFVVLLVSFLFPLYAYVMFSQSGGKLQEKFYNLIIQGLGEGVSGKIVDIG